MQVTDGVIPAQSGDRDKGAMRAPSGDWDKPNPLGASAPAWGTAGSPARRQQQAISLTLRVTDPALLNVHDATFRRQEFR